MAETLLIPSIEARLRGLIELNRRNVREHGLVKGELRHPAVTLTREYGCEGYPVALRLQALLEKRSGEQWVVMDRALLEAVAKDHELSAELLDKVGTRSRFMDEMISTFAPRWKSDRDYYRLLCRHIVALAHEGNVILVGRGAVLLTQDMPNCFHFRIIAPLRFKIDSISSRADISPHEAQELIQGRQRQRDAFLKDFLGRDVTDATLYHLLFNNARCSAGRIAALMADLVLPAATG